ncbi:hypothetical protein L249_7767 [Ophiocordyceps polyrhachis-furcata BCC 54312]|uniref:Protein phosphatase n=1 Tax=Ophiocordyceps polyrhachis-furcata BCC 54312 TaxID=1330021 RepID=A0A367LAP8_9HYPO|nr:hypothetical protein L249_7767 [Ophiocordyceps polyrhachis-furcata BCC 54312]
MATGLALRVSSRLRSHFLSHLRPSPVRPHRQGSFVSCYSTTTTTTPRLGFHLAASFSAKDRPFDPSTHVFHFESGSSPVTTRRPDSGHDAFFVSRVKGSDAVAFGVADGVGGWTESGVNPADFSNGLCNAMAVAASAASGPVTARKIMSHGYDAVCRDERVRAGGSTACVAIASSDGILDLANLGDSGFLQLRLNAVNAVSEPQTHTFNTPYQLSLIRPRLAARMAALGGSIPLCDLPRDADVYQHRLRHGDVILLATDGLLDNLFHQDILRIASRVMISSGAWTLTQTEGVRVADSIGTLVDQMRPTLDQDRLRKNSTTLQSLLATELVMAAKAASVNTKVDGPFSKQVRRYYPRERWHGGKVDDICVVAAVVCQQPTATESKL